MSNTASCVRTSKTQPRTIPSVHTPDCPGATCLGCHPCGEAHCGTCRSRHLNTGETVTCAHCVGAARDNLNLIGAMTGTRLDVEARNRGVNSEAMMLNGPTADVEAWGHRALSASMGRVDAAYLEDCRDELHPLWVLGVWDFSWRDHLGHEAPKSEIVTIGGAHDYLSAQLTYMAQQAEPDFSQFAREIRECRAHLEDVLRDGERPERDGTCPMRGKKALVKDYGRTIPDDRWVCPGDICGASYTEHDYRLKVDAVYVLHAPALSDAEMQETYRVPAGSVRAWAAEGKVRKHGKRNGRRLYNVSDVLGLRDGNA